MKYTMVNSVRVLALVPLTALCIASIAVQAQTAPLTDSPASMHQGTKGSDSMKQMMMGGMERMQNMPSSGDTDKDFAMMMKMHHQQGVDMAKIELQKGKSPVMKAMAKQIISAQQKEILQFDQWLAKQK